jgi:tRNA (guanine-N7-)-methyltransferase
MAKRKRSQKASGSDAGTHNTLLPQVSPYFRHILLCIDLLQKKHYRQRAHANPFSDHTLEYPTCPEIIDWAMEHYPAFTGTGKTPEFADVGCGFGGLLITLAPLFPDTLMLG